MSAVDSLRQTVVLAENHVRSALSQWDATNVSLCEECCGSLRMAVAELTDVQQILEQAPSAGDGTVMGQLRQLQAASRLMGRLVDASEAFRHGMALRIGPISEEQPSSSRNQFEA